MTNFSSLINIIILENLNLLQIEQKLDRETVDSIEQKTRAIEESCSESDSTKEDEETAELWVEKYKPRTYLELLSDEARFNFETLLYVN